MIKIVSQGPDYQSVFLPYRSILSFWTTSVTNFLKFGGIIFPQNCHHRFSIFCPRDPTIQEEVIDNVVSTLN